MNVLVMKVSAGEATVLADNGVFMTIPAKSGMKEGAEFEYGAPKKAEGSLGRESMPKNRTWKRYAIAIAASLLICVLGLGTFITFTPAGYIDININPGVRLAVNQWGNVISAEAINEDGNALLGEVNGSLLGEPENSVSKIINQAWKDGTLRSTGHVLLTISDNDMQRAQDTEMKLMASALETVRGAGLSVDITLQKLDGESFNALRKEQYAMDDKDKSGVYDFSLRYTKKGGLYIVEAKYAGNGVIEVEFSKEVLFTGKETITVKDINGAQYPADIKETDGEKLLLQCGGLKKDNIYKITVGNAGAEGKSLSAYLYINVLGTGNENQPYPDDMEGEGLHNSEEDGGDIEAENPDTGEDDDTDEPDEKDDDEDAGDDSEIEDDDEEDEPDAGDPEDDNEESDEHEDDEEEIDD